MGRYLEVIYLSPGDKFKLNDQSVTEYTAAEIIRDYAAGWTIAHTSNHVMPFCFASNDDKVFVLYN